MTNTEFSETPTFFLSSSECKDCHHSPVGTKGCNPGCSFQVSWSINPHMKLGKVDSRKATLQHQFLKSTLKQAGAKVVEMPFIHGAYDSVFIKDNALLLRGSRLKALVTNPAFFERKIEQAQRAMALKKSGFEVEIHRDSFLEGGDVIILPNKKRLLMGFGFRTQANAASSLEKFFQRTVTPLELRDPRFYHLDTAFACIETKNGLIGFAYRNAFTRSSWQELNRLEEFTAIIEVTEQEALNFGLNMVQVHNTVILGGHVPDIQKKLISIGIEPVVCALAEFQLSGGSAACLTSLVHSELPRNESEKSFFKSRSFPQEKSAAHSVQQ